MTVSRHAAGVSARRRRLGKVLRERSLITREQLESALQAQQASGTSKLGEVLVSQGLITREALIAALEEVLEVSYCDASQVNPEPEALRLLPRSVALRIEVLPVSVEDRRLRVIAADPRNLAFMDEVRFAAGMNVAASFGFREEILPAAERAYGQLEAAAVERILEEIPLQPEVDFGTTQLTRTAVQRETQEELRHTVTPAVRVVSAVIAAAVRRSASDIHFEHVPSGVEVRLRVDGLLYPLTFVDANLRNALVSRLKILADLDIAERRVSQDGRFLAHVGGRAFDVRVSTLPTQFGEKVVLRLLDPHGPAARIEDLGLSAEQMRQIEGVLDLPQGMLLVCGPTGSGKSTTLYGALSRLRRSSINITTVEDPVEYMIQGANQVQVNVKAGRTFANCLRSILRQDPNVLMVGEIRDDETAEIALQASQTGHLVLSTLHTNDAVSAIARLRDLHAQPFLISASVTMVIGQRLVRKLCACRRQAEPTTEQQRRFAAAGMAAPVARIWVPVGCEDCHRTGYKGRAVIAELLHVDEQLRPVIAAGESGDRLRTLAEQHGMKFMRDDALDKVSAGLTSLEEVLRVVPFERRRHAACGACGAPLLGGFLFCPFCAASAAGDAAPPATLSKPTFTPEPAEIGLS